MIKLYKFSPAANLPDPSPFCMKVETFLKMSGLKYENIECNDPRKGPKGKLPFLEDGATTVTDSSFIIDYLTEHYQLKTDDWLDTKQLAIGHCLNKLLDERFYWIIVYSRWIDQNNWPQLRDHLFKSMIYPLRILIGGMVRKQIRRNLYGQGVGRHSAEEIYQLGRQDLQVMSDLLGDQDFIFGDKPTSFDCTLHAYVAGAIQCSFESPINDAGKEFDNLVAYNQRMNSRYYLGFEK